MPRNISIQRESLTAIQNIINLCNNDKISDVTFVIGSGDNIKRFKCHRVIFAAQSKVFESMLCWASEQKESSEIIMDDINPDAFDYVQKIFYTAKPELDPLIVADILYVAKKYLLSRISKDIINVMINRYADMKICSAIDMLQCWMSFSKYPLHHFRDFILSPIKIVRIDDVQCLLNEYLEESRSNYLSPDLVKMIIKFKNSFFPTQNVL